MILVDLGVSIVEIGVPHPIPSFKSRKIACFFSYLYIDHSVYLYTTCKKKKKRILISIMFVEYIFESFVYGIDPFNERLLV